MKPQNYKEAILAAIPLVRLSWWQAATYRGFTKSARGKYCPIIAVAEVSSKEITDEAIFFMNRAAGERIDAFNDKAENVEQVIAVMEKAAE